MDTRVLFISGVGRSGSTLIERTLGTDPRFVVLGEVTHLWERSLQMDELCGCGLPFSECPFWTEVGQRAFGGWDTLDAAQIVATRARLDRVSRTPRLLLGLGGRRYRKDVQRYGALYAQIYRAAAEVNGADVVVDSSKQPSIPYVLTHQDALDVRILHCVRDSRAVAYSWTKTVDRPEAQVESFGTMTRYSPSKLSLVWIAHNVSSLASRLTGQPVTTLRYEDWVRAPRAATADILRACDLEPTPVDAITDTAVTLVTNHTCSGNPLRFRTGEVRIRLDERWREDLPTSSNRLVTAMTLPLLRLFHYVGRQP
ncbi:sulfotransferase domain-containing protein [Serinicoccus profundi]|uniref:sulfotransferase domain-containing protein n=1 Tax=Serinicoccus profundi TaxID=1078471 RepID=UPI000255EA65|nr:sulfotransferase domain-containing protein [Serinicoccus profundi]